MKVSEIIRTHRDEIVGHWSIKVTERLGMDAVAHPQLINDLPRFLDDIAEGLDMAPEGWMRSDGAEAHGEQRMELGVDIGGLAEEFGMIAETVLEVAVRAGASPRTAEVVSLLRLVGRGTASSVRAYARMRDRQLAEEAAGHFAFVAHELRTPLHTARMAAQLLAVDRTDTEAHLERLKRAHEQLSELVDNSLVEARLRGEPQLRLQPQGTRELLAEAAEGARLLAWRKDIEITVGGDEITVQVDRKTMVSALTNLVVNAVKFSREGGGVELRACVREDRVLFEVDDACGGMPDDLPGRLFQPFLQGGKDRSGFGLGLMIVKQAVEAHGGAVRVTNCPPRGCRFTVELPLSA